MLQKQYSGIPKIRPFLPFLNHMFSFKSFAAPVLISPIPSIAWLSSTSPLHGMSSEGSWKMSEAEAAIMSTIDFVMPLKQVGIITRSVLEAVFCFYAPRRVVIVTSTMEIALLQSLLPSWRVGKVEFVAEETFFVPNFNLTMQDILNEYDYNRGAEQREPGWWIQQFIKLGAATQIPNISPTYIVWDGDLIPLKRWPLVTCNGSSVKYTIAILQAEARSEFNTSQYNAAMKYSTSMTNIDPEGGGTFVAHHMIFQTSYLQELMNLITATLSNTSRATHASTIPWPLLLMSLSRTFFRFSEYKTYATFMTRHHPGALQYHPLSSYGAGGLRYRGGSSIIADLLPFMDAGGIPYAAIVSYANTHFPNVPYLQLDHVYGLEAYLQPAPLTAMEIQTITFATGMDTSESMEDEDSLLPVKILPLRVA